MSDDVVPVETIAEVVPEPLIDVLVPVPEPLIVDVVPEPLINVEVIPQTIMHITPQPSKPLVVFEKVVGNETELPDLGLESVPLLLKDENDQTKNEMNLSVLLLHFLRLESNKKTLTSKMKQMIVLLPLMKSGENAMSHLENMEVLFTKIVADKKINVMDTREIIELLKEMYIIYDTMQLSVTAEEVEKVFKVLVQVFVEYKLGNQLSAEEKDVLIGSINTILTLCTQMIDLKETTKKLKKKVGFCPCF